MNKFQASDDLSSVIRFDGFEVCWAGSAPRENALCFGSEDGRLLLTNESGEGLSSPTTLSRSGEAINAVAWLPDWVSVTTRHEVNLQKLSTGKRGQATLPNGAHAVVATEAGYFVCAAGRLGLVLARPDPDLSHSPFIVGSPEENARYFYRIINLRAPAGGEVLACATRKDGIAALEFRGEQENYSLDTISSPGFDVVDVCALEPGLDSLALAALGRDGMLVFFRDVLVDKHPVTMKFKNLPGIAYRVLSCRGDIYLVTSKGLFVLGKLAERVLQGDVSRPTMTPMLTLPMEPVDANLAHDRWLLVVDSEQVRKFDVGRIHESIAAGLVQANGVQKLEALAEILSPTWEARAIPQRSNQLALVG
jgi:hypothetical protein